MSWTDALPANRAAENYQGVTLMVGTPFSCVWPRPGPR